MSLMEFLQELLSDAGTRADFLADPHGTLAGHGLAHLSPADVHDAIVLVEDTRTADFDPYGDGAAAGFSPPPLPTEAGHGDAVQYLSGYLTGTSAPAGESDRFADPLADHDLGGTGFGEDVDADLPGFAAGHHDTTSFGSGHPASGLVDDPGPSFDEDPFDEHPFDGGPGADTGFGADPDADTDADEYGDGFGGTGTADPYAGTQPYDAGPPAIHHHDVDF
jgi:hypothetical protein